MPLFTFKEGVCAAAGFVGGFMLNAAARRPLYAGFYQHIILGTIGFYFGSFLDRKVAERKRIKLQVLNEYMSQHPEDFVEVRRKFKDVMEPWYPNR